MHLVRRALFEHVFTVPEHLVRSLAPPGLEGAESAVREQLRVRSVLDLGIGAGPNLKYYAAQPWVRLALPRAYRVSPSFTHDKLKLSGIHDTALASIVLLMRV